MSVKRKNANEDRRRKVVAALKALSNDNRLAIFEQIRSGRGRGRIDSENRLSVCEVAGNFDIALSTISHHIKELRTAGLITCERDGQSIHWTVNEETIGLMVEYLTGNWRIDAFAISLRKKFIL